MTSGALMYSSTVLYCSRCVTVAREGEGEAASSTSLVDVALVKGLTGAFRI